MSLDSALRPPSDTVMDQKTTRRSMSLGKNGRKQRGHHQLVIMPHPNSSHKFHIVTKQLDQKPVEFILEVK